MPTWEFQVSNESWTDLLNFCCVALPNTIETFANIVPFVPLCQGGRRGYEQAGCYFSSTNFYIIRERPNPINLLQLYRYCGLERVNKILYSLGALLCSTPNLVHLCLSKLSVRGYINNISRSSSINLWCLLSMNTNIR